MIYHFFLRYMVVNICGFCSLRQVRLTPIIYTPSHTIGIEFFREYSMVIFNNYSGDCLASDRLPNIFQRCCKN